MQQVAEQSSRPNPWPLYAQLRRQRVVPLEEGDYAVGHYDDVVALLHDPRVSSDPHNLTNPREALRSEPLAFIAQDPPRHDRLRGEVNRFFGPPASPDLVSDQEPAIRSVISTLIERFPQGGEVDIVDGFAYPLPVSVITRLLGVPPADQPRFSVWAEQIVSSIDSANLEDREAVLKRRDEGLAALDNYLAELIKKHRDFPDGSMLSGLANDTGPDVMNDADLRVTGRLLLIAGHETTVNLITNGMLTLLRNPEALARLRDDPAWVVRVVEELLRYEPPVQYLPNRAVIDDVTIDGCTIPKGSHLTLLIGAANRDPDRFADPDRFDPDRPDNEHLGFGSGLHYCLGAPLARLESQPALATLARRLVNPRLVEDPPPYRPSPVLRGPRHLRVAYDAVRPG
jgi:cytochrome P450